jgi:hypothetical protein
MRILFWTAIAILFIPASVHAQNDLSDIHQMSAAPAGARFEIVQSELAARWTFRLDRFCGAVAQLTKTSDGSASWSPMEVEALPQSSTATRARYQLFCSGIAAKFTFLIDTDSGKTWQLVSRKTKLADGTEAEIDSWELFTP